MSEKMNPLFIEKESLPSFSKKETGRKAKEKNKEKNKKKIALIYWIGGGLFLLLLLAGLGLSFIISERAAAAERTPLISRPELREDPSKISTPKRTDQYASDIKNRKRIEKKEAIEADRMDRIAMRWEEIYKAKETDFAKKENKGLEAFKEEKEGELRESSYPPSQRKNLQRERSKGRTYANAPRGNFEHKKRGLAKGGDKYGHDPAQKDRILKRRGEAEGREQIVFNTLERKDREASKIPIARVGGIIDGDQKIRAGQYIKFRLTENLELPDGEFLPINTPLMGLCSFGNSRVKAEVGAVYSGGKLLSIRLKVFDSDLIEGIAYHDPRIKAQEQREVESAGAGLYDDLFYEIPYAGAFLTAGKNMLRNRSREKSRKVSLTNNYRITFQVYHK